METAKLDLKDYISSLGKPHLLRRRRCYQRVPDVQHDLISQRNTEMFNKQGMFYKGHSKKNSSKSAFLRIAQTATGGIGVGSLSPVCILTPQNYFLLQILHCKSALNRSSDLPKIFV